MTFSSLMIKIERVLTKRPSNTIGPYLGVSDEQLTHFQVELQSALVCHHIRCVRSKRSRIFDP